MELVTFVIPGSGMFVFDVTHRRLYRLQLVEVFNGLAKEFKIAVKKYPRKHKFLIDGQVIPDLLNALKIFGYARATCS